MLALRAHVEVGFELCLPDSLSATEALDPQTLGAHSFGSRIRGFLGARAGLVIATFTLEPGHWVTFSNSKADSFHSSK
jgi:hypothetical protein